MTFWLRIFIFLSISFTFQSFQSISQLDSLKIEIKGLTGVAKIEQLKKIALLFETKDTVQSFIYLNEAIELAKQLNNQSWEAELYYEKAKFHYRNYEFDLPKHYLHRSLNLFELIDNPVGKAKCWVLFGELASYLGDYEESFEFLDKALPYLEEAEEHFETLNTYRAISNAYISQNNYEKAIQYLDKSIEIAVKHGFKEQEMNSLVNKSLIEVKIGDIVQALDGYFEVINYYQSIPVKNPNNRFGTLYHHVAHLLQQHKLYEDASFYYLEALNCYKQTENKVHLSYLYTNLGEIEMIDENWQKALSYFNQALALNKETGISTTGIILLNISYAYIDLHEPELALINAKKALEIFSKQNNTRGLGLAYSALGHANWKVGNIRTAELDFKRAIEFLKPQNLQTELELLYKSLMDFHGEQGNYKMALTYQKLHAQVTDSLYNVSKTQALTTILLKEKLATRRMELDSIQTAMKNSSSDLETIQKDQKKSATKNKIIIGFLGLALLSSFYLLFNFIKKQKSTKKQLEEKAIHQQELHLELNKKNQEINHLSINIVRKNQALKELKLKLEKLRPSTENAKDLQTMLNRLKMQETLHNDWDYFKELFTNIFPDFFEKLSNEYPDLSQKDLRLCGLIRSTIANQEIADILGISIESVHSARYRLRKKLNLDRKINLDQFLSK